MIGWLARWLRYQRALNRLTSEGLRPGYERIKAKARAEAGLPPKQRSRSR